MTEVKIVVIDGIRYREDDAKRRGLLADTPAETPVTDAEAEAKAKEAADAKAAAAAKKEADDAAKAAEAEKSKQPANKSATPATK
ncbi:hypothetical protein ACIPY0_00070 [Paenarthrobacter nicotinovorans]|uniref:hypothetical protein n=1 Tax=Paenarthrobacter nicotinovorans TaxID=29320 RepID=UPI0037F7B733